MNSKEFAESKIWIPVNHNGTALSKEPMTFDDAQKEANEYSFQTGNGSSVVEQSDPDINW